VIDFMGKKAVLMPRFSSPTRNQATLDSLRVTLSDIFHEQGYKHIDVAWRNLGAYVDNQDQTQTVMLDMGGCVELSEAEDDSWINQAIESLKSKM
jgi:hypothetical protein